MDHKGIKKAAESIACHWWERNASRDQIALELEKAFPDDQERGAAVCFATDWLDAADAYEERDNA